jgi:hypothetical protein
MNFDYLGPERKTQLLRFFDWFEDRLPRPRGTTSSTQQIQAAAIPADAGALVAASPQTVAPSGSQSS